MKIADVFRTYEAVIVGLALWSLLGGDDIALGLITPREAIERARWRLFVIEYGGRGAP